MDKEIRLGRFDKWGYKNSFSKGELARELTYMNRDYDKLEQQCKKQKEELKCTIGIVEHNRIINEKNKEIHQLKDNWNMLKEHLKNRYDNGTESISYRQVFMEIREAMQVLEIQQELEKGSDSK